MSQVHSARAAMRALSLFSVALCVSLGCGSSPERPGSSDSPAETTAIETKAATVRGIQGKPLYSKNLGPDHTIEFYEFGVGSTVVREALSADSGQTAFLDATEPVTSLADLYTRLNPMAKSVPSVLVQADQRATQLLADQKATQLESAAHGKREVSSEPTGGTQPLAQEILTGASGCSSDVNGDGWSGSWFINNFCNAGGFRWCQQNFGNASWNDFSKTWASWRQMEGDWNLNGHITLQECHCGIFACGCPNQTDADHDVLARHYEIWTWNPASSAYASGTSQCGHMHVDVLWNN